MSEVRPLTSEDVLPNMSIEEAASLKKDANWMLQFARDQGWSSSDEIVYLAKDALRAAVTVERLQAEIDRLHREMESMTWVDPIQP